jgi:hypothetical protein
MKEMKFTEVVDAYRALSEQLYLQYRERRDLEWRILVALWSLLAAATYLCASKGLHLGWWSLVGIVVLPLQFIWVAKIVRGEVFEQNLSRYYRQEAERILKHCLRDVQAALPVVVVHTEESSRFPEWMDRLFESYWWWPAVQLGATVLLCGVFIKFAW